MKKPHSLIYRETILYTCCLLSSLSHSAGWPPRLFRWRQRSSNSGIVGLEPGWPWAASQRPFARFWICFAFSLFLKKKHCSQESLLGLLQKSVFASSLLRKLVCENRFTCVVVVPTSENADFWMPCYVLVVGSWLIISSPLTLLISLVHTDISSYEASLELMSHPKNPKNINCCLNRIIRIYL